MAMRKMGILDRDDTPPPAQPEYPRRAPVERESPRAPSATEAARLYGELEAKARANVLDSMMPENKLANFRISRERSPFDMAERFYVSFKLNGNPIQAEVEMSREVLEWSKIDMRKAFDILMRELAGAVVEEFSREIADALVKKR